MTGAGAKARRAAKRKSNDGSLPQNLDESPLPQNNNVASAAQAQSEEPTDDDIIDVHLEMDDWLTNQIERDSQHKKKRCDRKYSGADMCIVGLERIVGIVTGDTFMSLPLSTIDSQLKMVSMYQEKFYEQCISTTMKATAADMQDKAAQADKADKMVDWLRSILFARKKHLLVEESMDRLRMDPGVHSNSVIQQPTNYPEVRVKKVEIPKFSGVLSKWPAFKSSFLDCFHNNNNMSGATKFYHLMAHLEEDSEAYNTIGSIDRTDGNYESAWKTLCEAYDNERMIVDDILQTFIDMPPMDAPSRSGLIAICNTTNALLCLLPKYGVLVEH